MAPTISPIIFADTTLDSAYTGFYATILDDVFTPEECQSLLSLAVASGRWRPTGLAADAEKDAVHSDFRNSEQIVYVDAEASEKIYQRLLPLVEEDIGEISVGGKWDGITGKKGRKQGPTWKLAGIAPRLSFLRYGPGHYFKPHCDGLNERPAENGSIQKSFVTLHLYLNGTGGPFQNIDGADDIIAPTVKLCDEDPRDPLVGGATRFWTPNKKQYLDVFPRVGRVLVFQQRMLVHSGEEVFQGVKYSMRSDFMYRQIA